MIFVMKKLFALVIMAVLVMAAPAILNRVSPGTDRGAPTAEETEAQYRKIGVKIFIPALGIGVFALL